MAIRCDDCRYLFSKKRVSCPFCGGQTIRDDRPDADLLAAGYTMAPQGRQQTIPDDPFEAMLRAYQEEQTQPIPTPPAAEPSQPEQPQDGVDFFSHFQGGSPAADIPTVESTRRSQPQQEPPRRQPTQPDPYEAELREIERQQRPFGIVCPASVGGRCFGWWCSCWWSSPPSGFGTCATPF